MEASEPSSERQRHGIAPLATIIELLRENAWSLLAFKKRHSAPTIMASLTRDTDWTITQWHREGDMLIMMCNRFHATIAPIGSAIHTAIARATAYPNPREMFRVYDWFDLGGALAGWRVFIHEDPVEYARRSWTLLSGLDLLRAYGPTLYNLETSFAFEKAHGATDPSVADIWWNYATVLSDNAAPGTLVLTDAATLATVYAPIDWGMEVGASGITRAFEIAIKYVLPMFIGGARRHLMLEYVRHICERNAVEQMAAVFAVGYQNGYAPLFTELIEKIINTEGFKIDQLLHALLAHNVGTRSMLIFIEKILYNANNLRAEIAPLIRGAVDYVHARGVDQSNPYVYKNIVNDLLRRRPNKPDVALNLAIYILNIPGVRPHFTNLLALRDIGETAARVLEAKLGAADRLTRLAYLTNGGAALKARDLYDIQRDYAGKYQLNDISHLAGRETPETLAAIFESLITRQALNPWEKEVANNIMYTIIDDLATIDREIYGIALGYQEPEDAPFYADLLMVAIRHNRIDLLKRIINTESGASSFYKEVRFNAALRYSSSTPAPTPDELETGRVSSVWFILSTDLITDADDVVAALEYGHNTETVSAIIDRLNVDFFIESKLVDMLDEQRPFYMEAIQAIIRKMNSDHLQYVVDVLQDFLIEDIENQEADRMTDALRVLDFIDTQMGRAGSEAAKHAVNEATRRAARFVREGGRNRELYIHIINMLIDAGASDDAVGEDIMNELRAEHAAAVEVARAFPEELQRHGARRISTLISPFLSAQRIRAARNGDGSRTPPLEL